MDGIGLCVKDVIAFVSKVTGLACLTSDAEPLFLVLGRGGESKHRDRLFIAIEETFRLQ